MSNDVWISSLDFNWLCRSWSCPPDKLPFEDEGPQGEEDQLTISQHVSKVNLSLLAPGKPPGDRATLVAPGEASRTTNLQSLAHAAESDNGADVSNGHVCPIAVDNH